MSMRRFCQTLPIAALSVSFSFAEEMEMVEQHTHVHGHWRMFAAMDDERLTLSLSGPAADVLGFEHVPETDTEREAVRVLLDTLAGPDTLSLSPAAKCKPAESPEIMLPEGFAVNEDTHDDSHSAHHEITAEDADKTEAKAHDEHEPDHADHEKHDEGHQEAEIEVVYVFSCAAAKKLTRIEHRLFDLYPSIEEIDAVFLADSKQAAQALTRSSPDLRLR